MFEVKYDDGEHIIYTHWHNIQRIFHFKYKIYFPFDLLGTYTRTIVDIHYIHIYNTDPHTHTHIAIHSHSLQIRTTSIVCMSLSIYHFITDALATQCAWRRCRSSPQCQLRWMLFRTQTMIRASVLSWVFLCYHRDTGTDTQIKSSEAAATAAAAAV